MTELRRKGSWMVPVPDASLARIEREALAWGQPSPFYVLKLSEIGNQSVAPIPDFKRLDELAAQLQAKLEKKNEPTTSD